MLQAALLPLLPAEDSEVARDLAKGRRRAAVVTGEVTTGRVHQVAGGYHRVCASYLVDEDTDVACRRSAPGRCSKSRPPGLGGQGDLADDVASCEEGEGVCCRFEGKAVRSRWSELSIRDST